MTDKLATAVVAMIDALREELGTASTRDLDPLVTAIDVGVPVKIWSRAAKSGELRGVRLGGVWRARRSDADAWIAMMLDASPSPKSETEQIDSPLDRALSKGRMHVVRGDR